MSVKEWAADAPGRGSGKEPGCSRRVFWSTRLPHTRSVPWSVVNGRLASAGIMRCQPCVQIDEHEAATGRVCPARMSVPGAAARVNALQLLAVTGGRFLSAFDGVPCAPGSDPPFKRQCTHSVSAAEAAAADALVAVIDGKAPDMLSAQQVVDLAEAAQLYSAGAVLEALPAYIEPLFSADGGLPLGEVCCALTPGCCARAST